MTKRAFLIALAALVAGLSGWFWASRPATIEPFKVIGSPGATSIHHELDELPIDIVLDGKNARIISRQENGDVLSWSFETGQSSKLGSAPDAFAYCRDRTLLLIGGSDGALNLIDLTSDEKTGLSADPYEHAAWSSDCSKFALTKGRQVELWDASTRTKIAAAGTAMEVRNGLAVSADGRFLATAEGVYDDVTGHDTLLEIFALSEDGKLAASVLIDQQDMILGMWKMVFSAKPDRLIVASQVAAKSGIEVFSAESGAQQWNKEGFASYWIRAVAISPDGRVLATGDEKGLLRLWNADTGEMHNEINVGQVVQSASFSEDGMTLAISRKDSTIALYDVLKLLGIEKQ